MTSLPQLTFVLHVCYTAKQVYRHYLQDVRSHHGGGFCLSSRGSGWIHRQYWRQCKLLVKAHKSDHKVPHPCFDMFGTHTYTPQAMLVHVWLIDWLMKCTISQKRTIGEVLLSEVFKHLGLEETDYFGLQYLDSKEQVVCHYTECVKPRLRDT